MMRRRILLLGALVAVTSLSACAGTVSGTAERAADLVSVTQPAGSGAPPPAGSSVRSTLPSVLPGRPTDMRSAPTDLPASPTAPAGGSTSDSAAAPTTPATSTPAPHQAATTTPVHQSVTVDGIEYSGTKLDITLVQVVDPVVSDSPAPDAGTHYVGLQFTIKNVGTTTYQDAPGLELAVTDDAHQQHQLAWVSQIDAGQLMPAGLTVAPEDSVTGYLAVELPDGTHVAKVAYSSGAGGEIAYWTF
jgi:hypothetical protein